MPADIRLASLSDVDRLAVLEDAAFVGDRISRRSFRHLVAAPTAEVWIAVGVEAEPAGYAIVLYRRGARTARLYSLAVAAAEQGSGHGSRLLSAAEQAAFRRGVRALRLEVRQDNRRAPALFEGCGYRRGSLVPNYYADGAAAERYEKALVGPGRTPDAGRSARKEASLQ